jgi:hypothetical protein
MLAGSPTAVSSARTWLLAVTAVSGTGCIKEALLNGQIASTREASGAFDGVSDFELAYNAASGGIVQFEGMHQLAPENTDALFMLTKAYASFGFAFAEDDMEMAQDAGDAELAEYHKQRAIRSYEKAIMYGMELWKVRGVQGFEEAKASEEAMKAWLEKTFTSPEDVPDIMFVGVAWMSRTNLMKDDAQAVADLWIGATILERAVALDPTYNSYSGVMALAIYHSRSATADLETSRTLFEEVIAKTERKSLLPLFAYGSKYACAKVDGVMYVKLLEEVVAAKDPDPSKRLMNAIAQRRARRWLGAQRMFDACSIDKPTEVSDAS